MTTTNPKKTYIVYNYQYQAQTRSSKKGAVEIHQTNSLKKALRTLRKTRDEQSDDRDFIIPYGQGERDAYPFRNRIGPIFGQDKNAWGYQFLSASNFHRKSMWIEKRDVGEQEPMYAACSLRHELMGDSSRAVKAREICSVDYVADAASVAIAAAVGGQFDEKTQDFVFPDVEGAVSVDEDFSEESEDEDEDEEKVNGSP